MAKVMPARQNGGEKDVGHPAPEALQSLLSDNRVLVCAGSGGVGKTTMSAALAILGAISGKRTIVITIDPARRLATSLGLNSLSPIPTDLTPRIDEELKSQGLPPCKGRFHAVMPDTTRTFEAFVRAMAGKNESLAARVLRTSIYKIFAKEFSGANEYMAMAKLYELYNEDEYDLIVLDTPPSANTRMFLEAPRLLSEFFDDRIIKWFVAPGARLFASGVRKVMSMFEHLTGHGFMSDLIEFTSALFELRLEFRENLENINQLLHKKRVCFLAVTSPERLSRGDTQEFVRLLNDRGYRLWGFIVNRTLSLRLGIPLPKLMSGDYTFLKTASGPEGALLKASFDFLRPALEHERAASLFLTELAGKGGEVVFVPEQPADVHSIGALVNLCTQL